MIGSTGISIGEVAERTGLSVHTLRFYEREGVFVGPVCRGPTGRRVYSEDDIAWLGLCTKFRAAGMPLTAIRAYADMVREGPGNEKERLNLLRAHQDLVTARIAELTECLRMITHKVNVYESRLAEGTATQLWTHATPSAATTDTGR
jgi:DNA-binding transcriptional MerR regulator